MAVVIALGINPRLAASVLYAGTRPELAGVIRTAYSTGIRQPRSQTAEGMLTGCDGIVRYKAADEPAAWCESATTGQAAIAGQLVDVTLYNGKQHRCRVSERCEMDGGVRLNLEAEFAER